MAAPDVDTASAAWAKAFQGQRPAAAALSQAFQASLDELRVRVEEVAGQALSTELRLVKEVQDLRVVFETQFHSSPTLDVQAIARTAAATAAYTASREFRQSLSPMRSPSRSASGENRDLDIQLRKLAQDVAMEERSRAEELVSGLSERVANLEMALEGLLRISAEREKRLTPPGPIRQYPPDAEKEFSGGGSILVASRSPPPQGQRESVSPVDVRRMLSGSVVVSASVAPQQLPAALQSWSREVAGAPAGFNAAPSAAGSVAVPVHQGPPQAPRAGGSRSPSPVLAGAAAMNRGWAPRPQQLPQGCPSTRSTLPARFGRGGAQLPARAVGYAPRGAGSPSPPPVGPAAAGAQAAGQPPPRMATPCPAGEPGIARSSGHRSPSPSSCASASTQSGAPLPQPVPSAAGAQRPDSRRPLAAPAPLVGRGSASVPLLPSAAAATAVGGGVAVAGGDQAAGVMPPPNPSNVQAALPEGIALLNAARIERQRSAFSPLHEV